MKPRPNRTRSARIQADVMPDIKDMWDYIGKYERRLGRSVTRWVEGAITQKYKALRRAEQRRHAQYAEEQG